MSRETATRAAMAGSRLYGGPMASVKQIQVTFDCAEPERVARFWCEVLGYVVPPPPEGLLGTISIARCRLSIRVQRSHAQRPRPLIGTSRERATSGMSVRCNLDGRAGRGVRVRGADGATRGTGAIAER
jgi:hypothetical protein